MSERAEAQAREPLLNRWMGTLAGSLSALGEIVREVRPRLARVDTVIQEHLATSSPAIQEAASYVFEAGGKRLRPAVMLAAARALGYEGDEDVHYAAAVEMIHTATLVHDDIIDHAATRRGRATANARWGNQFTVLLGDWLYTRAMEIALAHDSVVPLRVLSQATTRMTEGEILGLGLRGRSDVSRELYLEVSGLKTAELFAAAASIPGCLGPTLAPYQAPLAAYGHNLGMCFQIIDDLLDITASEERLGKPVFSDLREGRLTLPFIIALPQFSSDERHLVETMLAGERGGEQAPRRLRAALDRYGALSNARESAREYARLAAAAIDVLPASAVRDALQGAPLGLVDREF